jgi:hypothetical protein
MEALSKPEKKPERLNKSKRPRVRYRFPVVTVQSRRLSGADGISKLI